MPNLAEITAAETEWVRRFNQEKNEAVALRDHVHSRLIAYLECTPNELFLGEVNEGEYVGAEEELQFFGRERLIRGSDGVWFAPMTLQAGLTTLFLRIDFKESAGRFIIGDEAFDAEASGPAEDREAVIGTFFDRLTTRIVETTRLPTWQKNIKQRSFKGFDQ